MLAQAPGDMSVVLEFVKVVGLPVAVCGLILYWLTRSLIPKIQEDAAAGRKTFADEQEKSRIAHEAEQEKTRAVHSQALKETRVDFSANLKDIAESHKTSMSYVVKHCADEREAHTSALERAYGTKRPESGQK